MLWDCRWRWYIECCGSGRAGESSFWRDLGLFLFFFVFLVAFHRCFEVADSFSEAFAERSELAGAEEQERDRHDDEDLAKSDFAFQGKASSGCWLLAGKILGLHAGGVKNRVRRARGAADFSGVVAFAPGGRNDKTSSRGRLPAS